MMYRVKAVHGAGSRQGSAKRDFDVAVPNPLPIQRREAKVPYKATLRSRIRGWLKRRARAVRKSLRNQ